MLHLNVALMVVSLEWITSRVGLINMLMTKQINKYNKHKTIKYVFPHFFSDIVPEGVAWSCRRQQIIWFIRHNPGCCFFTFKVRLVSVVIKTERGTSHLKYLWSRTNTSYSDEPLFVLEVMYGHWLVTEQHGLFLLQPSSNQHKAAMVQWKQGCTCTVLHY